MNILFIYPNAEGYGRIPLGMSIIMTILAEDGHNLELFDTTFILKREHTDNVIREKAKLVISTDISHLYESNSSEKVDQILREKIKNFFPNLIAVGIVEDNYILADHLIGIAKSIDKNIPVIVGGNTPTVAPNVIMENPLIDFLIKGEGEEAMKEFCELMEKGKSVKKIKNLWYKENGKIVNNPIRYFVDMDTLPIQNLDFWDSRHFIKPYDGRLYKAGFFEMSRGCLNKCTYCINGSCQKILHDAGKYQRRKSIHNTIEEIKALKDKLAFEMIFFCDDNFLAMPGNRMKEFSDRWLSEINLPYWINTTAETINKERLTFLKETGCCGIGIGVESGSKWLLKNILWRKTSLELTAKAFDLIHEFDIRTTANCMIGFPGELEEDIFETIKVIKKIKPKSCDICFVAPYIGTPIHYVSRKMGYIETWDKPGFKNMAKDITVRRGPVINVPHVNKEKLTNIFYDFIDYIEDRLPIPEKFLKPAPGSDISVPRGKMGSEISDIMKKFL